MAVAAQSAIARHAAVAKQLLAVLQQHAEATAESIGSDLATGVLAAIEQRDELLRQLDGAIAALKRERVITSQDRQVRAAALHDLTTAMHTALDAHARLMQRAQLERDRLAVAVGRANRPDAVARQYSPYASPGSAGLSVTG
jgi:hypothetical protein